jgi:hypothetical protein
MPTFPSSQWMEEFCEQLVTQPRADEVAQVLDGVYRFVVEPSGPVAHTERYDVEIRPSPDGQPPAAQLLPDGGEPRLTMTARYDRWKQLITGKLDVGMAVMLRRVRIQGDLQRLIREMGSAKPLMDALQAVDSQWME